MSEPISNTDIEELQDLPTAVTVNPVLTMIVAHTSGDKTKFKEQAYKVAKELELNNKQELALYIYAQFGDVNTFNITD